MQLLIALSSNFSRNARDRLLWQLYCLSPVSFHHTPCGFTRPSGPPSPAAQAELPQRFWVRQTLLTPSQYPHKRQFKSTLPEGQHNRSIPQISSERWGKALKLPPSLLELSQISLDRRASRAGGTPGGTGWASHLPHTRRFQFLLLNLLTGFPYSSHRHFTFSSR